MEWSKEAEEYLESRRAKLPGKAAEIDLAIERIRKDSEKAAANAGVGVVEKEHVKLAIAGLPKIEVVTEATEGSFAFVKALVILGGTMLFVGLVMQLWFQSLQKYGEEPTGDVDIYILRWMLPVGAVVLAAGGVLYWHGRRQLGAESEGDETLPEGGSEEPEGEGAEGEKSEGEEPG